ncbi:MAG: sigma-70 family RNA polymerase sigma factor [Sphingobium sp.]
MKKTEARLKLYLEYRPALVDYAAPIVGSRPAAEDAVQEAYFRFVPPPGPPAAALRSPASYLYRVVRNIALDMTRRISAEARRDKAYAEIVVPLATTPSPEQEAIGRDELQHVEAALDELPHEQRLAFEMSRLGGATFHDIGLRLGVSKATAHRLAQEAFAHVMSRLKQTEG